MDAAANLAIETFDVLVIGSGISGINTGYRLTTTVPDAKFAILEQRKDIGGTWDLFNYPGVRSDSDFYTFGFAWWPWTGNTTLAEKHTIIAYFKEAIEANGFGDKFRLMQHVQSASWSSQESLWTLTVCIEGERIIQYKTRWIVFGTGYYDYEKPRRTVIPGIENFKGQTLHPQFWPKELDYVGKEIAVIGSGATAVTIVPNMAEKAKLVTMVQRSPTYIFPMINRNDAFTNLVKWLLPAPWSGAIMRWRWAMFGYLFFFFCHRYPQRVKIWMRGQVQEALGDDFPIDPHFNPTYNPGDQRLCMVPDGDLYKFIRQGKVSVVTGKIETVTKDGVRMEDGQVVKADIIITATGLKMRFGGAIKMTIDGIPYEMGQKHIWNGVMLQDAPNICIVFGYTNASFTLGADASAHLICRMLRKVKQEKIMAVIPRLPAGPAFTRVRPVIDINCTYVNDGLAALPVTGSHGPWRPRTNYFYDMHIGKRGNLEQDVELVRG